MSAAFRYAWLRAMALAVAAAVVSYWVSGGFAPAAISPAREPAGEAVAAVTEPAVLTLTAGDSCAAQVEWIRRLRTASVAELRAAWHGTSDYAQRSAITARWAAVDSAGCYEALRARLEKVPSDFGAYWGVSAILFSQWALVDHAAAREALATAPAILRETGGPMTCFIDSCAMLGGGAWQAFLDDPRFAQINPPVGTFPRLGVPPGSGTKMAISAAQAVARGRYGFAWLNAQGFAPMEATPESIEVWRKLPFTARTALTGRLVPSLAEKSPEMAAAFVAEMSPYDRQQAAVAYTGATAKTDPAAAWKWLTENACSRRMDAAAEWSRSAPLDQAPAILAAAAPSRARDQAGVALAKRWLETDPEAAKSWVLSMDDAPMQRSAWRAIAYDLVAKSPDAGVAALTAPGAPPLDTKTVGSVAALLHAKHPEAAAKFVAALPPELARAAAAK